MGRFDPDGPGGFDSVHPSSTTTAGGLRDLPLIGRVPDVDLDNLRDESVITLPDTTIIA